MIIITRQEDVLEDHWKIPNEHSFETERKGKHQTPKTLKIQTASVKIPKG